MGKTGISWEASDKCTEITHRVVTLARMEDKESSNTGNPIGADAQVNLNPSRDRLG